MESSDDQQPAQQAQPGQTVAPTARAASGTPAPSTAPSAPSEAPAPQESPAPPPATKPKAGETPPVAAPEAEAPQTPDNSSDDGAVQGDGPAPDGGPAPDDEVAPDLQPISWTASEFIAHDKSFGWYAALAAGALALAALVYFISRDLISVSVVIIAALMLGVYGGHKPRQLEYRIDTDGLSIGKKHFGYDDFRSFSVLPEGAFSSIVFMPMKRFAVPTTIYYAPEDEDRIASMLSSYLPFEERDHDAIDRLMHRIRY